jgi:hypothetical protein
MFKQIIRYVPRFSAQLVQFQWASQPINKMPQTAFHDFAGLRITLTLATFTTVVEQADWFSGRDILRLSSLRKELGRCSGIVDSSGMCLPSVYAECCYDDSTDFQGISTTVVLALLVEDVRQMTTGIGCIVAQAWC